MYLSILFDRSLIYISQVVRTTTLRWELYVNGIKDERSLYSKTSGAWYTVRKKKSVFAIILFLPCSSTSYKY